MNSDIDSNSDTLYSRLIAWLIQESVPAASSSADGQVQGTVHPSEPIAADFELDRIDPLDLEELNIAPFNTSEAAQDRSWAASNEIPAHEEIQPGGFTRPYNFGDIPTVENRFQAILKRKLQVEIERHPPLFPWETELSDYEPDSSDVVAEDLVPTVRLWMPQLSNLSMLVSNLSVPVSIIPDKVLGKLLDSCCEAVYSRRQLGAKLVNAVENLFPDQFQSLNDLAGLVLLGSGRGSLPEQLQSLPYEEATAEQKMTLALLAAKEIISTLTVQISPTQTPVKRQWQTAAGVVSVQAEYQMQEGVPKLRVTCRLPRGGSLTLRTPQASAIAQRTYPGYLSVESFDLQPNQNYPLEIRFHDSEQAPLVFAIWPTM